MPSLPRVITVDPTQNISRIIRSAADLLGLSIIQVDAPSGADALEELRHSSANLIITSWELDDDMQGLILALEVKKIRPETSVLILAEEDDPETVDEETDGEQPFVYLRRPVDIHQLLRVFIAGLKGENIIEAARPIAGAAAAAIDHGPLPPLNVQNARGIIKQMLVDVGAMAIILSARNGEVLLEDGAPGYLDRELLTKALIPTVMTTIEMSPLVGGQAQTIHFYDGDDKDVFVLSVGLHHFMSVVYDGQAGSRQFGSITRYGRRAAQDLIALLGASAYMIQPSEAPKPAAAGPTTSKSSKRKASTNEVEKVELELAVKPDAPAPEPEHVKLDPIKDFDVGLFDQMLDTSAADDIFDFDKLAEMVNTGSGRKEISLDEAIELGVLPN
jgi:hypothetical protein